MQEIPQREGEKVFLVCQWPFKEGKEEGKTVSSQELKSGTC